MPAPAALAERVLIVEDDLDTLESLAALLSLDGFPVVRCARTVADAERQLAGGFLPTAVLLDVRLQRDDGESFARRLRANPAYRAVSIVVLSGDPAAVQRLSTVVNRALLKPPDWTDLLAALRDVRSTS